MRDKTTRSESYFDFALIFAVCFLLSFFLMRFFVAVDETYYYSYLPSALAGTLNTFFAADNIAGRWMVDIFGLTSNGYLFNPYAVGSAVMWSPFFMLGHVATLLFNIFSEIPLPSDGYSIFYYQFVMLGTSFYVLIGITLLYKLLRDYYSRVPCMFAVFALLLASPLIFYGFTLTGYSHGIAFFTMALFLWIWHRTKVDRSVFQWFSLGAVAGLMTITRWQDVLYILIPMVGLYYGFLGYKTRIEHNLAADNIHAIETELNNLRKYLVKLFPFAIGFLLIFSVQMIVWQVTFGSYLIIPQTELALPGQVLFNFFAPHVLSVLFSPLHGFLFWTPAFFIGILGLWFFAKKDRHSCIAILFGLVAGLYFLCCWAGWFGNYSFGLRHFVTGLPLVAFGIAAFFDRMKAWKGAVLLSVFIFWNTLLLIYFLSVGDIVTLLGVRYTAQASWSTVGLLLTNQGWALQHFTEFFSSLPLWLNNSIYLGKLYLAPPFMPPSQGYSIPYIVMGVLGFVATFAISRIRPLAHRTVTFTPKELPSKHKFSIPTLHLIVPLIAGGNIGAQHLMRIKQPKPPEKVKPSRKLLERKVLFSMSRLDVRGLHLRDAVGRDAARGVSWGGVVGAVEFLCPPDQEETARVILNTEPKVAGLEGGYEVREGSVTVDGEVLELPVVAAMKMSVRRSLVDIALTHPKPIRLRLYSPEPEKLSKFIRGKFSAGR